MKFSIIIPHKNTPLLLQRCLNSIPVSDDVQVIIVDDNSDSSKVDFANFPGLGRLNTEVHFTKRGRGAGYARNEGLKHAVGDWLLFADADDFFETSSFELLLNTVIPAEYDVITWGAKYTYINGTTSWFHYDEGQENSCVIKKIEDNAPLYNEFITPWIKMVRRSFIEKYHICFDEVMYGNDELFSTRVAVHSSFFGSMNLMMYHYERVKGSLVETYNVNAYKCRAKVLQDKRYLLKQHQIEFQLDLSPFLEICRTNYMLFIMIMIRDWRMLGYKTMRKDYLDICAALKISKVPFVFPIKKVIKKFLLY